MPILGIIDSAKTGRLAGLPTSMKYANGTPNTPVNLISHACWDATNSRFINISSNAQIAQDRNYPVQYSPIMSSTNGTTWTTNNYDPRYTDTTQWSPSVGIFATSTHIVSLNGSGGTISWLALSSLSGTWSKQTIPSTTNYFGAGVWDGTNIALFQSGNNTKYIASSNPSGTFSTGSAIPSGFNVYSAIYQNGRWHLGTTQTNNYYATSVAGIWNAVAMGGPYSQIAGDGANTIVAHEGSLSIKVSTNNGTSYTSVTLPTIGTGMTPASYPAVYSSTGYWFLGANGGGGWYTTTPLTAGSWTAVDSKGNTNGPAIPNGSGTLLLGTTGGASVSTNSGQTWTNVNASNFSTEFTNFNFYDYAYGNNVFVRNIYNYNALTGSSALSQKVQYSTDGVTWSNGTISGLTTTSNRLRIAGFANGKFYGHQTNSHLSWYKSSDGITWTAFTASGTTFNSSKVVGNGSSTLVSFDGDGANKIQYSTNEFATFTTVTLTGVTEVKGLAWSPTLSLFVAIGYGTSNVTTIHTSSDGVTWTSRTVPNLAQQTRGIVWSSKAAAFIGIAPNTQNYVRSTNGTTWTQYSFSATSGPFYPYNPYGDANGFTLQDNNGQGLFTSTDGITWTNRNATGLVNAFGAGNGTWTQGLNPSGEYNYMASNDLSTYVTFDGYSPFTVKNN